MELIRRTASGVPATVLPAEPGTLLSVSEGAGDSEQGHINYRKWSWVAAAGIFVLFFATDVIEHAVLPQYGLGRVSWFLTTAMATMIAFPVSWLVLSTLERVHQRLARQNRDLVLQAEKLAQQSERLALAVQEAHHRIKNNLQTVAALLTWHGQQLDSPADARGAVEDSVRRVQAIALVHDLLTRDSPVTEVNAADALRQLAAFIHSNLAIGGSVRLELDLEDLYLPSRKCTSLILVANELILNAMEHGFPSGSCGLIRVHLARRDGKVEFTVRDNGRGLPPGFDMDRDMRVGLDVAASLLKEDLGGMLRLRSEGGTVADAAFSLDR